MNNVNNKSNSNMLNDNNKNEKMLNELNLNKSLEKSSSDKVYENTEKDLYCANSIPKPTPYLSPSNQYIYPLFNIEQKMINSCVDNN